MFNIPRFILEEYTIRPGWGFRTASAEFWDDMEQASEDRMIHQWKDVS
jgi:hypothetical protein